MWLLEKLIYSVYFLYEWSYLVCHVSEISLSPSLSLSFKYMLRPSSILGCYPPNATDVLLDWLGLLLTWSSLIRLTWLTSRNLKTQLSLPSWWCGHFKWVLGIGPTWGALYWLLSPQALRALLHKFLTQKKKEEEEEQEEEVEERRRGGKGKRRKKEGYTVLVHTFIQKAEITLESSRPA